MLPFSDACERNKRPILAVLSDAFAASTRVLEVGSGTGQHAVWFAHHLPHVVWQPSEVAEFLPGLRERIRTEGSPNLREPVALDVRDDPWPTGPVDALFSANTLHIMSWENVQQFFRGAGQVLVPGGILCVYGPFKYGGRYTSDSNEQFDWYLRSRDPLSGIRDAHDVDAVAAGAELTLMADHPMPANNQARVWRHDSRSG
jgi:cyclopropane fatty-acyl-phospholipid synthase-like methyltransferase